LDGHFAARLGRKINFCDRHASLPRVFSISTSACFLQKIGSHLHFDRLHQCSKKLIFRGKLSELASGEKNRFFGDDRLYEEVLTAEQILELRRQTDKLTQRLGD
jgi:hypothetical protein